MDLTESSYQFHRGLEPPLSFFRREWKSIAIFAGLFCVIMLAGVILIDPAFYYPRLQTDPLLYYLKARALVETGSTAARAAINAPPFPYAAMPGVLRAPILLAFSEFDYQWRAIQVVNIPIIASVALMSAYIVSWSLPQRKHWMAIGFAFLFTVLSPVWVSNVFSPLADGPYAFFSLLAVLVAVQAISAATARRAGLLLGLFCLLVVVVFLVRFTGPVLFVFAAALGYGKWRNRDFSSVTKILIVVVPLALIVILTLLNSQAIFGRYLAEPLMFANRGSKGGMILNLFGLAIPDQILPDFHLLFSQRPVFETYHSNFARTAADVIATCVGSVISAVVLFGAWRARSRLVPEILYVLAPLPVLVLMLPSTARYLMPYQPFFWLFFLEGLLAIRQRFKSAYDAFAPSPRFVTALAVVVLCAIGALRWFRVAGTAVDRSQAVPMTGVPAYVADVSGPFRSLRGFLETLPRQRTLLVGSSGTIGRWDVISHRSYYYPDSALPSVAASRDVYLVVECGTIDYCQSFSALKSRLQDRLCNFGEFTYDSVFAVQSKRARAEVFRVRPAT